MSLETAPVAGPLPGLLWASHVGDPVGFPGSSQNLGWSLLLPVPVRALPWPWTLQGSGDQTVSSLPTSTGACGSPPKLPQACVSSGLLDTPVLGLATQP